jgi:hypothetical protein
MDDSGRPPVPHPPYDELHAAAEHDPAARAHLDALRESLEADRPDPQAVAAHATRLRGFAVLEARIANWWDSPATQRWIKALADANL